MPQLLVSVRNAVEAKIVSPHPIGILDVKEPNFGPLGAATPETLTEIGLAVPTKSPKSFSAGELSDWVPVLQPADSDQSHLRVKYGKTLDQYQFVKIGLASMADQSDWKQKWQSLFRNLPPNTSAVAVAYLDYKGCNSPTPADIINLATEKENCTTVLFDTFQKTGNLFSHVKATDLKKWVVNSQGNGLKTVIAGSVSLGCLERVVEFGPDYIGVRGAICDGEREGQVASRLVSGFLDALNSIH